MARILVAGQQITSGNSQVSDSSQSLSQGATAQASSLEEITRSLAEMASQTNLLALNAAAAEELSSQADKLRQMLARFIIREQEEVPALGFDGGYRDDEEDEQPQIGWG